MKRCVLFLVIFFALSLPTNVRTDDSSPSPSLNPLKPESSIDISVDTSHYMILANGMPPSEASEPQQPAKDRSQGKRHEVNQYSKESIQPSEKGKKFAKTAENNYELDGEDNEFAEETETINDPLEGYNRAIFKFNDKLYFWVLKPAARGYRAVLPEKARISIRKLFSNAAMPVRFVNCALQGKMKGVAIESTRFTINSTVGVGGLFDPAQSLFHLKEQEADFDQTLGLYGMRPVFFFNLPFLGPSSLRGTLGLIGDTGCDPTTYLLSPLIKIGIRSYGDLNETSLTIGDYEALTESALDPYIAIRNAYYQNRKSKLQSE
jgi:phospholipid-binding lipoprotein MlaA